MDHAIQTSIVLKNKQKENKERTKRKSNKQSEQLLGGIIKN